MDKALTLSTIFSDQLTSELVAAVSMRLALWSFALILALIVLAAVTKHRGGWLQPLLFWLIAAIAVMTTVVLIFLTVKLNLASSSKGPVHWHADFEVWACGNKLELEDPSGFLSNKIGTSVLHEHNDGRIHMEGVVVDPQGASLGHFLEVVGGTITENTMVFPTNVGKQVFINGQLCDGLPAEVQVFAYQADEETDTFRQTKLDDPAGYIISPQSVVPPGDCIVVEFAPVRDRTDKLCEQYRFAVERGDYSGETDGN